MNVPGLYVPRDSVVHRLPAGAKLVLLAAGCLAVAWLRTPAPAALGLAVVLGLYAVARLPARSPLDQARPVAVIVAAVFVAQVLIAGWSAAVVIAVNLVTVVLLAALLTVTTRTGDIVDAVARAVGPLRRFGVDPDSVGLVVGLGVRSVAVVAGLAHEVREAQVARGGSRNPVAFLVPLVLRTIRYADRLAEAMVARGVD